MAKNLSGDQPSSRIRRTPIATAARSAGEMAAMRSWRRSDLIRPFCDVMSDGEEFERRSAEFQNPANAHCHGCKICRRNVGNALLEALLGDGSNLVRDRYHIPSGAINRDEQGRSRVWRGGEWDYNYRAAAIIDYVGREDQARPRLANLRTQCGVQPHPPHFTASGHCSRALLYRWIWRRIPARSRGYPDSDLPGHTHEPAPRLVFAVLPCAPLH